MKLLFTLLALLLAVPAFAKDPTRLMQVTTFHVFLGGSGGIVESPYTGTKYLLTNWHVCKNSKANIVLSESEIGERIMGRIIHDDEAYDLCLIEVTQRRPALKVGNTVDYGDMLYTRGYPEGKLHASRGKLVKEVSEPIRIDARKDGRCPTGFDPYIGNGGIVKTCIFAYPSGITTLYAKPGASGSPVVNENEELVGVVQSATSGEDRSAGIILVERVRAFLKGY